MSYLETESHSVLYATFSGMCQIMKEKSGILNKTIAIDMGLDLGIFSKLLGKKREINDTYKKKMYRYFHSDVLDIYEDDLKNYLLDYFELDESSYAYDKIMAKPYLECIDYLFWELNESDLYMGERIKLKFTQYIRHYLAELFKNNKSPEEKFLFNNSLDRTQLEKHLNLSKNYILEIDVDGAVSKKYLVLLCPHQWQWPELILDDVWLCNNADAYLVVRFDDSFLSCIHQVLQPEETEAAMDIEVLDMGKIHEQAKLLADQVYECLLKNADI